MEKQGILEIIWEVPVNLWEEVESLIVEMHAPKHTGRKKANPRQMLNGIIYIQIELMVGEPGLTCRPLIFVEKTLIVVTDKKAMEQAVPQV